LGAPLLLNWSGSAGVTSGVYAPERIYIAGGSVTQIYNPVNDSWSLGSPMPSDNRLTNLGDASIAVVNDQLYAIGGIYVASDDSLYAKTQRYTPLGYMSNQTSSPLPSSPTTPTLTAAVTSNPSPSPSPSPTPSPTAPALPSPTQQPTISILYPQNNSVFNAYTPEGVNYELLYQTNSTLSWVGYSLDSANNVTVAGNTTNVNDFDPSYCQSLTVYANDTSGNWATPQTVTFRVNHLLNDSTPTPPPLQDYTPTPSPTPGFPFDIVPIIIVAFAIVTIGALVYFRECCRKKRS